MSTKLPVTFYKLVVVDNPAVSTEISILAPGQGIWRVKSIAFRYTTDANVADRNVILQADDQSDVYWESRSSVDQSAGLTSRYSAFPGASPGGFATTLINLALPDEGLVLQPGYRLRTRTVNKQVGDQYTFIRLQVQEFPQGPDFEWLPTVQAQIEAMG